MIPWLGAVALAGGLVDARPQQGDAPVTLVVRVFDGPVEVTADARVTLYPAGSREGGRVLTPESRQGLVARLQPGLYDLRAVLEREGQVLAMRRVEGMLVVWYPDEEGEHLQVVNFKTGFGALALRLPPGVPPPSDWAAAAYPAGNRVSPAGKPIRAPGYLLFVLRAGKYDVRIQTGTSPSWFADLEVPLDRTRLKQVPPP
jgi:hypothetical protein